MTTSAPLMTTAATPGPAAPSPTGARLHFGAGLPGFPAAKSFTLAPWGSGPTPFYVLASQDLPGLRFVVVGPRVFFPWYEPQVPADTLLALDVTGPQDVDVLVMLTLHSKPEETTANLLGPLVVNPATGAAVQAVLSGSGYNAQTPVVARS